MHLHFPGYSPPCILISLNLSLGDDGREAAGWRSLQREAKAEGRPSSPPPSQGNGGGSAAPLPFLPSPNKLSPLLLTIQMLQTNVYIT